MAGNVKPTCDCCNKFINFKSQKHLICEGECKKAWHVPKCIAVTLSEYKNIVEDTEKSWFCDNCDEKRKKRRSVMNATLNSNSLLVTTPSTSLSSLKSTDINTKEITLKVIYEKLEELTSENRKLNHALDGMKKIVEDYKRITDSLIDDNESLRNENETLKRRMNNIEYKLDITAQHKLNCNIIINGIPEVENEKLETYITKIAKEMKINFSETDIKSAVRTSTHSKSSGLPSTIIVEFHDKNIRDEILQKKKDATFLNTNVICNTNANETGLIYLSEQLTKRNQYIMKLARNLKRDNIIKYVWSKQGEIFIRRDDKDKAVKITNVLQLNKITKNNE